MKRKPIWMALIILSFILTACQTQSTPDQPGGNASPSPAAATQDPNAQSTAVAQTVEAELTQVAAAAVTDTPLPTPTEPAPTQEPQLPTETPVPQLPTATVDAVFELQAQFVADVTIPDGTPIVAGDLFTKTWRIRNVGSLTWGTDFSFVFINGERMEGSAINLPVEVPPGGEIDLSIPMIAPEEAGPHLGYWMLQTPETDDEPGTIFGLGVDANQALYVEIEVIPPTPSPTETNTPTATPEGGEETPTGTPTPEPFAVTNISLTVDTNAYQGACPVTLNFNAELSLSGPLTFDYQVDAIPDDPGYTFTDVPTGSLSSDQQGPHTLSVPFSLPVEASVSGQIIFHVTTPTDITSPPVVFTVACEG